MLEPTCQNK